MIIKFFAAIVFLLCLFANKSIAIDSAFSTLRKVLPYKMVSFFQKDNQFQLQRLIRENEIKNIVELGSWLGASTISMSEMLSNDGKIYAVDTWQGSEEHHNNSTHAELLPNLYEQFLSNVKHHGAQEKVIPVRLTTLSAAQLLNVIPDLVYVDASHDELSVYNDVKAWYKKLRYGGIMCGDDFDWPTVKAGVEKIAKELNQQVYSKNSFWWFNPK